MYHNLWQEQKYCSIIFLNIVQSWLQVKRKIEMYHSFPTLMICVFNLHNIFNAIV